MLLAPYTTCRTLGPISTLTQPDLKLSRYSLGIKWSWHQTDCLSWRCGSWRDLSHLSQAGDHPNIILTVVSEVFTVYPAAHSTFNIHTGSLIKLGGAGVTVQRLGSDLWQIMALLWHCVSVIVITGPSWPDTSSSLSWAFKILHREKKVWCQMQVKKPYAAMLFSRRPSQILRQIVRVDSMRWCEEWWDCRSDLHRYTIAGLMMGRVLMWAMVISDSVNLHSFADPPPSTIHYPSSVRPLFAFSQYLPIY